MALLLLCARTLSLTRLAADKIIMGCLCLVFTLVVVVIFVSSFSNDTLIEAVQVPDILKIPT